MAWISRVGSYRLHPSSVWLAPGIGSKATRGPPIDVTAELTVRLLACYCATVIVTVSFRNAAQTGSINRSWTSALGCS